MKYVFIIVLLLTTASVVIMVSLREEERPPFTLCTTCPPGFELTEGNTCKLRTLYQQYESGKGNERGVGGLKTALPAVRDGFTPQQIDLGRYLFFDPVLSKDGTLSCATCHQPAKGFSDGLKTGVGIHQTSLKRASPTLWNVAFYKKFFWDSRAATLEEQMAGPLFAEEEMATTREQLLSTLNGVETYRQLFKEAFPDKQSDEIQLEEIYTSIAAFESTLISLNSRYDQYAHGYHEALSKAELEGLNIFRSFVARCAECHTPPLFTNQQIAVIGLGEPDNRPLDPGAQTVFNEVSMRGGFKVPSLRNITHTAPYSHSGKFDSLRDMVKFYTQGRGHAVPEGEKLHIHWHIWEPQLTDKEVDRLVDFLAALSDESFMPLVPEQVPSGLLKLQPKSISKLQ